MKKQLIVLVAAILVMLVSSVCHAATRSYDTSYGAMNLQFDGTYVSGTYTHQNGVVEGTLDGNVMTGTWRQSNGKGACIFTFSSDFSRFDAKWNYAGETGWRGDWKGTRKDTGGGDSVVTSSTFKRSYNTEYGAMTLNFNGDTVTGNYTHQNGKIRGTLDGDVLTGTWTQSNGSGSLIFNFGGGFNTFEGKWNYKGESSLRGGWNGKPK